MDGWVGGLSVFAETKDQKGLNNDCYLIINTSEDIEVKCYC